MTVHCGNSIALAMELSQSYSEHSMAVTNLFEDVYGDRVEHVFYDDPEDIFGLLHASHQLLGCL